MSLSVPFRSHVALAVALALAGCANPAASVDVGARADLTVDAGAAAWKPFVVADVAALKPAAPPEAGAPQTATELAEVKAWLGRLTDEEKKAITYWNEQPAPVRWSELSRNMTIEAKLVPPRAARALAMAHIAMYDATIATWSAKAAYRRAAPARLDSSIKPLLAEEAGVPTYPSEHAAIAYATAFTLAELFPEKREELLSRAKGAAETRLAAGANLRSDIDAGKALGEAVAAQVIAKARADGSDAKAVLPMQVKAGQWSHEKPMEPLAGKWSTWAIADVASYKLAKPKFPGDDGFQAELDRVETTAKNLTEEQKALALKWNLDAPAAQWNDIIRPMVVAKKLSAPRAARVLGYGHALMADTFITTWYNKYEILLPRPTMADPSFKSFVGTPPHPSYPSGHSSCSMAAATYLSAVFPEDGASLVAQADEAAVSRLYGGIHYQQDNEDGKALGKRLGEAMLARAKADGLP